MIKLENYCHGLLSFDHSTVCIQMAIYNIFYSENSRFRRNHDGSHFKSRSCGDSWNPRSSALMQNFDCGYATRCPASGISHCWSLIRGRYAISHRTHINLRFHSDFHIFPATSVAKRNIVADICWAQCIVRAILWSKRLFFSSFPSKQRSF